MAHYEALYPLTCPATDKERDRILAAAKKGASIPADERKEIHFEAGQSCDGMPGGSLAYYLELGHVKEVIAAPPKKKPAAATKPPTKE